MGSLVTSKAIPKDADVLVTINSTMDLGDLRALAGGSKGLPKPSTSVPTSSSPM
jgi:hypothetical protein